MAKASMLFEHTQRFVREVFAQRLRSAGFRSYKGEDIHWYRLVNGEVVHAIYFVTRHTALPANMAIMYGCHPISIPPVFQKSPYFYAEPGYEQMYGMIPETEPGAGVYGRQGTNLTGAVNRPYRVPDVLIEYPQDEHKAMAILEKILSVMEDTKTPRQCYEAHKLWRSSQIENDAILTMSSYFVDEVLFWEDVSLYPYCKHYVDAWVSLLLEAKQAGKLSRKADGENLERLLVLKRVLEEDSRSEYLQTFSERGQRTLRLLERNASICKSVRKE